MNKSLPLSTVRVTPSKLALGLKVPTTMMLPELSVVIAGSDANESYLLDKLRSQGANIFIGHKKAILVIGCSNKLQQEILDEIIKKSEWVKPNS